jgi:hypothetical protein
MGRLLAAAFAVAFLAPVVRAERITIYSYSFSNQYVVRVSGEDLEKSPSWKDDAENPPLSAKKAIKLANEMKDSLVKDGKDFKWILESASLKPARRDRWYWLLNYEVEFQGAHTGAPIQLRLVVLMDGTVIKPEVRKLPEK